MGKKKELKDLNLLDRFLFAEAVEDPEILQDILEIILGRDVVLKHLPQTEKEERKTVWGRQVRLDVWAMDENEAIYDTEVQKKNTHNLPKRTRLYNGLIDSKLLESGVLEYNRLNDVYIIMIMPFDLFGLGLYRYTFRMACREVPGLELEDGATRILLNTRGTNSAGVSEELIALLRYMEDTSKEVAEHSSSDRILKMQEKIEKIRSSEEIGVKYMNAYEERMLELQEAREEGLQEGLQEGREHGLQEGRRAGREEERKTMAAELKKLGMSPEEISKVTKLSLEEIEAL
ncbi:Rpn family recombination-promoting nuclease/putative transposase [Anaerovorax odorimutans]|uniref:Rpn family recombination-promoting nuclease/putative transposase n=1 Tax=Anaerovorax odorimutans TaxID=109327 RepID=A0ABT1RKL3_9FIRM|nr:Rpn family recombination-promoting nuclease/putative transposase [Anaerovorax odorimutans]MCQ4635708.1 Rpn family recombination-promoting nuclease/putative transposase [Anaerovorax odorimutans]